MQMIKHLFDEVFNLQYYFSYVMIYKLMMLIENPLKKLLCKRDNIINPFSQLNNDDEQTELLRTPNID